MASSAATEIAPLLPEKMRTTRFSSSLLTPDGSRPQAIAHRGFKKDFPENSMGAFEGAVEVGAHAIETDVHLSKDGVVVLSHDATLKRCFGIEKKISDCDWSYLETLQTIREPHQGMPRLADLLQYLTTPGLEEIWILLDIKLDDNPDRLIAAIAASIRAVKPSRAWAERILMGCWTAKYLTISNNHLPDFPIVHIGWNIPYARQFLEIPNVSFNMLQKMMIGPGGKSFMRDVKKADRSLFLWTVNDDRTMKWCLSKEIDGVITDDPKRFLELSHAYKGEKVRVSMKGWGEFAIFKCLTPLFEMFIKRKYGLRMEAGGVRRDVLEWRQEHVGAA